MILSTRKKDPSETLRDHHDTQTHKVKHTSDVDPDMLRVDCTLSIPTHTLITPIIIILCLPDM